MVFGGFEETEDNDVIAASALNDGAIYDAILDSWSAMSSPDFPLSPNAEAGFVGVSHLATPAALERVYFIDAKTCRLQHRGRLPRTCRNILTRTEQNHPHGLG